MPRLGPAVRLSGHQRRFRRGRSGLQRQYGGHGMIVVVVLVHQRYDGAHPGEQHHTPGRESGARKREEYPGRAALEAFAQQRESDRRGGHRVRQGHHRERGAETAAVGGLREQQPARREHRDQQGDSDHLLSAQVVGVALLVAVFAAGGLLLSQTAYRGGLGAPLAVVTLANPVAAAAIGLALLGERLQGGAAGILLALAGAGLASWGVVLLTRVSPVVPLMHEYDDHDHPVAAVLALEPRSASPEPALMPRQPDRRSEPGHLTAL